MTIKDYDKVPPLPAGLKLEGEKDIPPVPKGLVLGDVEKKSKVVGSSPLQSSGEDFPLLYGRDKKQMSADIRPSGIVPLEINQEQERQFNRLKRGFEDTTSPVVNKPVAETVRQSVPKAIKDGVIKDKTKDEGALGYIFNTVVDGVAELVAGIPNVMNPVTDLSEDLVDKAMGVPGFHKSMRDNDIVINPMQLPRGDELRKDVQGLLHVGTTYKPKDFDVTDGVQTSDIESMAVQAPRQLLDMAYGAVTGGGSFFLQSVSQNAKELAENPEAEKLTPTERMGYLYTQGIVQAALEKFSLNKILKSTGLSQKASQTITKEIIDEFSKKGVKATAKQIQDVAVKKASAFSAKLKKFGTKAGTSAAVEGVTEGMQTAFSQGNKLLLNDITGKNIFDEKDITTNFFKDVINSGVQGGAFGGVIGGGVSTLQNTNKAIREQVAKAQTPQDIEKIRTDIAEQVELGNITQEEADAANITADQYAKVAAKIPSDVDAEQKYAIIGGIEQREGIKKEIEKIKKGNENLDPAFHESSRATLELLEAKLEQTNDYLEGVIAGKKPTYRKEKPTTEGGEEKYYKTSPSGEETKITKEHYDLATAVREEQAAKNKEPKEVKDTVLETLKSKAGEFEKGETLQYFTDKAGEAPAQYYEKYGKKITDKLLESVPTEKLKQNLDDILNINPENPNVPILDKLIAERESTSSTPMEATTEGAAENVVPSTLKDEGYVSKYPKPTKPISQMSSEELTDHSMEVRKYLKDIEVDMFGAEGAKKYREAQRVLNNMTVSTSSDTYKEASALVDKMEASLSPAQQKEFFGLGEPGEFYEPSELRDIATKVRLVEESENVQELGGALKLPLLDFNNNPNSEATLAVLNAAKNKAEELGIDPKEMLVAGLKRIAKDIPDRTDLEDLASSIIEKLSKPIEQPQLQQPVSETKSGQTSENIPQEKTLTQKEGAAENVVPSTLKDESILKSDKDLKGNDKDEFMEMVQWKADPKVGDVVTYKDKDGNAVEANYRGVGQDGKAVLDVQQRKGDGKKYFLTTLKSMDEIEFPKKLSKGFPEAIEYAIDNGLYQEAIAEGKMTANDAIEIIKSHGNVKIPQDILDLSKQQTKPIEPVSETKETTTEVPDQTKATITEPSEPNKAGEGAGGEPPIKPPKVAEGNAGDGMKDLDKLANNVPDSGKVAEYMSKETIEKYTGETPTNDQRRGVQELEIALNHGEKIIEKAQTVFGKDYVEKTLDYIDQSTAPISNKALMYVSLENALGREKLLAPERAADITKQQALVYEQSQKFARENSLALNYQKLRRIAKVGYDIEKVTDSFFSPEEKAARGNIKEAVEADADTINKEAERQETGGMTPEVEKLVQEGVEKEIAKIYEQLPKDKKTMADKAIAALEAVQKKLRGKTYDAGLGIPVAIVDMGITTVKLAIKAGVKVADAIELGINKIKEKWGKEWPKEDEFRKDLAEAFKNVKSTTDFVKEALIEKGFGRETTIKGEKKTILDWKKLAGKAGTVSKISENVADVLKDKGLSAKEIEAMKDDLVNEYIDLRTSVIEKAQTELAKRNKENVTPEQKSAAKKLSELYTYGLFEAKSDEFDIALNKALGAKVSEKGFSEAKEIAKALETIYTATFKGAKLNDVSAKAAIEKLEDRLRVLLFREARGQGNRNLRMATIVRNYFEIQQTMILNNLKQAVENPFSGFQQNVIDKITEGKNTTSEMTNQRRKLMKDIYKDMLLNGGIGYGKVEATFVNRQHIDDYINKLSDNKLYHGIASVATGKATLNAMDAMWKAGITEKKFAGNLITILTHETNPNKMSKADALTFVSEQLTGQTFKDAQVTSKQIIEKINKDAGTELIKTNKESVDRFANDIVKAALEMGGKISKESIEAAYNAAYKAAGLGLGHQANNPLSGMITGYSAKIEGDINQAIRNKEWNRAAALTYKSILFRNILNPFVGGGTNWLVLKLEKTGLGMVTGLAYRGASKSKIDMSTELGRKKLEERLYNHARAKDNFMRGLVGGVASLLTYAAFTGVAGTDDYRKWRARNQWAARYLDIFTPEMLLTRMAVENDQVKKYVSQSFNKNDAFDASTKAVKALEFAAKGKTNEAWGAFGEMVGSKANLPLPWRLVKDGMVIYQGAKGQDPYHGNYKPSTGFFNGVFQGGAIEWLGARPNPLPETPKPSSSSSTKKQSKPNKKTEKKQTKAN